MNDLPPSLKLAVETILAAIHERIDQGKIPLLVALDGGSGAGKSTLAHLIAGVDQRRHHPERRLLRRRHFQCGMGRTVAATTRGGRD